MVTRILASFLFALSIIAGASYYSTGGGSPTIGGAVNGGTDNYVLFIDPTGILAQSSSLQFDASTNYLTLDGASLFSTAVDPGAGAGTAANPGSLAFFNSGGVGTLYAKFGAADTAWTNVLTGASGWSLIGNSGTNSSANFIGTTDAVDFIVKTNNAVAMTVSSSGSISMNSLGAGVVHSDLNGLLTSSAVVNADVDNSAAIARSKLASGTAYRILANDVSGVMSENAAITASRAVESDANGQLVASATTATELGYVSGVTSAIQTQLNNKQATGNYITALTGDVTATGPGSVAATLATVNSDVGSFTNANITVNAKGLITAAASGSAGFTDPMTTRGDIIYRDATNTTTRLGVGAAGTFPRSDGTDLAYGAVALTTDVSGVLPIANGGTNNGSLSVAAGVVYYGDGTKLVGLAAGSSGQLLQSNGAAAPSWTNVASATPTIFGSRGTPRSVVAATGITTGASHMSNSAAIQDIYVEGSAAGDNVCATISDGTIDGQRMTIIGRNNSNTLTFDNTTTNVVVNGSITLGADDILTLRWDSDSWTEISRNQ